MLDEVSVMTSQVDLDDLESARQWDEDHKPKLSMIAMLVQRIRRARTIPDTVMVPPVKTSIAVTKIVVDPDRLNR